MKKIVMFCVAALVTTGLTFPAWAQQPQRVNSMVLILKSGDDGDRKEAAEALGKMRAVQAVPALMMALHDPDDGVRKKAAEALGLIGDRRAVPALIAALKDDDGGVRGHAVVSLGDLGDPVAIKPLLEYMMTVKNPFSMNSVQKALAKLDFLNRIVVRE